MPSVILIIKTPSLKLSDLTYCCDAGSSVYQLKLYLQNQYPSKPNPEEQRLIYQGRLLRDEEIFQVFLRDLDKEQKHTLHLVYTLKRTPSAEAQERQTAPVEEAAPIDNTDGLRLRHTTNSTPAGDVPQGSHAIHDWSSVQHAYPGWASHNSGTDDVARQLLLWQQTYQQYWTQYMYHMNNAQAPLAPSTQAPQAPTTPVTPAPAPANIEPPQQEAARAPPQLVGVGGVAQEDDDEAGVRVARDWLDWMYVGSRLAILLGVMYYYSSLPRFMLVTLIVAGIYLYQKAIYQRRRNALLRNGEVNNNRAQQNEPGQDAPEADANAEPANEPIPDENVGSRNEGNERIQNAATPNGLNVAINLLIGFFTSLIPEVPAPEAIN